MQRWTAGITAILMATAVACGSDDDAEDLTPTAIPTTSDDARAEPTSAPTEVPTDEPEPTPTQSAPTPTAVASVDPQPATASSYVGGSDINLPDGEPGELAVVAVGPPDASTVVILRNNTGSIITRISVEGVARDGSGSLMSSGSDQGLQPRVVRPGEVAFGYVYFGFDPDFPPDVQFEFSASFATSERDDYFLALDIEEVENPSGDAIVGILRNHHDEEVEGPIGVQVICFDADDNITGNTIAFASADSVAPGGQTSFRADLFRTPCPLYLIGASGYAGF